MERMLGASQPTAFVDTFNELGGQDTYAGIPDYTVLEGASSGGRWPSDRGVTIGEQIYSPYQAAGIGAIGDYVYPDQMQEYNVRMPEPGPVGRETETQWSDPAGMRGYGLDRASVVNPPSVSMEYHDPRRVHPTYPYPTTTESSVTPGQFIEAGGAPGGGGFSPQTYVPGTDPYSPDNPYGVDETALQYRGQVAGLTPEVRQTILNTANSEQQIENLIQIYGLAVVERVLREDIASGQFHEVGDARSMSDDAATQQMLSNRRQGVIGNTDWMR